MSIDKKRPLELVVFFNGDCPDVSPYLDPENFSTLLGPMTPDTSKINDVSKYQRTTAISKYGGRIGWRGENCGKFSYIVFEQTR